MKKLFIALTATLVCVGAFGQGKLAFQLPSSGLIYFTTDSAQLLAADRSTSVGGFTLAGSSAYTGNGGTIAALAGTPSFTVGLFAGATASSLAPVAVSTTTINSFNYAGTLVQQNVTFANLPSGTAAFFQIQVYDSRAANAAAAWAAGEYAGQSTVFSAIPQTSVYSPIYQTAAPVSSTLPAGTQALVDYPGARGLIALYATSSVVPEPSTFALAGLGLASLLIFRRRK